MTYLVLTVGMMLFCLGIVILINSYRHKQFLKKNCVTLPELEDLLPKMKDEYRRLTKKFKFLRHGIEGKLKGQIKSLLALGSVLVVSGLILVVSVILKLGEMI